MQETQSSKREQDAWWASLGERTPEQVSPDSQAWLGEDLWAMSANTYFISNSNAISQILRAQSGPTVTTFLQAFG